MTARPVTRSRAATGFRKPTPWFRDSDQCRVGRGTSPIGYSFRPGRTSAILGGMRCRPLGNTGLPVSAVGLGGVPLSVPETRPDEATAIKVIHHAIDQGVTFIDTADSYGRGESDMGHNERLFRAALAQLPAEVRARVVVATKGGHMRPGRRLGSQRPPGVPAAAVRGFPAQPRRRVPGPPAAPPARSRRADRRQHRRACPPARRRQVRFIGVSEYSVAQLDEAQSVTEIASTQNQYSLEHRQPERDGTLAATESRGTGIPPLEPTRWHRRPTAWGARSCSTAPGGRAPGRAPWREPAATGRGLAAGQGAARAGNRRC